MIAVARRRGDELRAELPAVQVSFVESDVAGLDLGGTFDVVVMAGNVPLFTPKGTEQRLVAGAARHVQRYGVLIAGFQLDQGYPIELYDLHCAAAGLELSERFATWDGAPFAGGDYNVSVHRWAASAHRDPALGGEHGTGSDAGVGGCRGGDRVTAASQSDKMEPCTGAN
jgi:hypothetical protein